MRAVTKRLRLESRGFRYKVALYLSYQHIKFDDETEGNLFEFQAYFLLMSRFGFITARFRSYWDM